MLRVVWALALPIHNNGMVRLVAWYSKASGLEFESLFKKKLFLSFFVLSILLDLGSLKSRSDFEKKSCPINLNRDSSNFAQKAIKCDLNKFIHPIPIQLTFDADTRNLPYNVQPFSNISAKECLYSDTLILISFQLLTFPPWGSELQNLETLIPKWCLFVWKLD